MNDSCMDMKNYIICAKCCRNECKTCAKGCQNLCIDFFKPCFVFCLKSLVFLVCAASAMYLVFFLIPNFFGVWLLGSCRSGDSGFEGIFQTCDANIYFFGWSVIISVILPLLVSIFFACAAIFPGWARLCNLEYHFNLGYSLGFLATAYFFICIYLAVHFGFPLAMDNYDGCEFFRDRRPSNSQLEWDCSIEWEKNPNTPMYIPLRRCTNCKTKGFFTLFPAIFFAPFVPLGLGYLCWKIARYCKGAFQRTKAELKESGVVV